MPNERPIVFSGPMVQAILDGRKTQTRRVITRVPGLGRITDFGPSLIMGYDWTYRDNRGTWHDVDYGELRCPYGHSGDVLWVRETWGIDRRFHQVYDSGNQIGIGFVGYRAEGNRLSPYGIPPSLISHWRSPMSMPHWACRLFLEIVNVRVERVQEITIADAKAELGGIACGIVNEIGHFQELWDSLNAKKGYGWEQNPHVWVVEFKRTEAANV